MMRKTCSFAVFPPLRNRQQVLLVNSRCWYIPVYEVANDNACKETTEDRQRERTGRETESNSANKDNCFKSLAEHSNKWQDEHGVFLTPELEPIAGRPFMLAILHFEGPGKFDPPFVLELGDTKQCSTDKGDHKRGDEGEDAFPYVFGFGKGVDPDAVKGSDHATSNDNAEE